MKVKELKELLSIFPDEREMEKLDWPELPDGYGLAGYNVDLWGNVQAHLPHLLVFYFEKTPEKVASRKWGYKLVMRKIKKPKKAKIKDEG